MTARMKMLGSVLAATLTAGVAGSAYATTMTAEEAAAELQQAFSLDPDIDEVIDANVMDGKIVLTGQIEDQKSMDRIQAILDEMELGDDMIDNQIARQ